MTSGPAPDPAWLAHRYDPTHDAVHFLYADRAARSRAPFLTDAELAAVGANRTEIVARTEAVAAAARPAPVHYIFHSAYCCSTLLARAFDLPGTAGALKEPQILNDMVGWRHRGGEPPRIGTVLDSALTLLAQPFEPGETVVIKPSNVVNGLASAMLGARPDARAILLYAPLRGFLTSIARKGMWGRLWVRDLLEKQLRDGLIDLGLEGADYLRLTDLQAAAVGWLAQQALFTTLARNAPERCRMLDSETLTETPGPILVAVGRWFGLDLVDAGPAIVAREFGQNAKTGAPFGTDQRGEDRSAGEALHRAEIDMVMTWAEATAAQAGIMLVPPSELRLPV